MGSPERRRADAGKRDVTLMDVARAAGVGKSTVSNVLNGSGRVGEAARARVLDMVDQLGYKPNQGARSLRSRKTMQLAYLMPPVQLDPTNLIMMQFLQTLLTAAAGQHYRVLVVAQQDDPSEDIRALTAGNIVDAFVLSDLDRDDQRVRLVHELGMPFACFGITRRGLPQAWTDFDNIAALAETVRHVADRGYTRPGYIGYGPDTYWDDDREAGFRAGLARCGIPGDGAGVLRVGHDSRARDQIRSFFASARPDAVLTGSDKLAIIVYGVAAELGLRVGEDLAVTGFDGSIGGELLYPTLTSVVIPVEDIARRVVRRALAQIGGTGDREPGEMVPTWLRTGDSTRPRPTASGPAGR